jgi:hypothetical protein
MPAGSFSRHHNGGDPYWSRVVDIAEEFRIPLRNIARGKKWETEAGRFNLIELAQAIVTIESAWRPHKETVDQKAVRLSARSLERSLVNLRAAVMRKNGWRGHPDDYPVLDNLKNDLVVVRHYAQPPQMTPEIFIAAAVIRGLLHANRLRRPNAPELPIGFGSTGIIVGLTCEALDRINHKKKPDAKTVDPDVIRKALTEHRSQLGV